MRDRLRNPWTTWMRLGSFSIVLCCALSVSGQTLTTVPAVLTAAGTTYPYTQQLQWLDSTLFVVGRLDGTLTLFRPPGTTDFGPVLVDALHTPANRGVEMLAVRDRDLFVSSNDSASLAVWNRCRPDDDDYNGNSQRARASLAFRSELFPYDADVGMANSGVFLSAAGREYLVTGHENGYVLFWSVNASRRQLQQIAKLDISSSDPIPSPFPLKNVRDIVVARSGVVITGSEDGDLVMLEVPSGTVLARKRYNPSAQRGINGLALLDDRLVAVACSVGPSDQNTWLFRVRPDGFDALGSADLKKDTKLPQSFAFRAALARVGVDPYLFASTQEGLLWTVRITTDDRLDIEASLSTDFALGSAIDYEPASAKLAVVGVLINLFNVGSAESKLSTQPSTKRRAVIRPSPLQQQAPNP